MSYGKNLACLIALCLVFFPLQSNAMEETGLTPLETDTKLKAVYHMLDQNTDQLRVQAVFLIGEADLQGPEGLSHYFEHLMYLSADKRINAGFHGRTGNAWVNGFVTTYYNQGDLSELDGMFAFVRGLLDPPSLPEKFMLEERDVVQREYDLRVVERPDRKMWDQARAVLYAGNGAGRSVIGTRQSIDALTLDAGNELHERCYHPANMVLMISGPLSRESAKQVIERRFGHLEAGQVCRQSWRENYPSESIPTHQISFSDRYVSRHAIKLHSLAKWTTGKGKKHDFYTLVMLRELLASTLEGGLAKPLRIDAFVVSGYNVWLMHPLDGSVEFWFQAATDENVGTGEAIAAAKNTIRQIAEQGIPEKSVERIRKRLLRTAKRKADNAKYHRDRAADLLSMGLVPDSAETHLASLEAVTREDLESAIVAISGFKRLVEITLVPESTQ